MKLPAIVRRMLAMCPTAWIVFKRCLQLCCLLLFLSLLFLLDWGGDMLGKYQSYYTALALYEAGEAVLLIAALAPVCIEDYLS